MLTHINPALTYRLYSTLQSGIFTFTNLCFINLTQHTDIVKQQKNFTNSDLIKQNLNTIQVEITMNP